MDAGDDDSDNARELEEVVVTAHRQSIMSAQAIKRDADQIVDSIVASDIGKLPDRSVGGTRLPGSPRRSGNSRQETG